MAHRRGFRGRGISESQRRKKTWISAKVALSAGGVAGRSSFMTGLEITTPSGAGAIGDTQKAGFALVSDPDLTVGEEVSTLPEESTVLRARGSLLFPKNEIGGSDPGAQATEYAFGFGVTDVRSLVDGSFPGPIVDSDWDGWMFLRQSTLTPVDSNATMVDVKAMRKIQTGDALFFAAEQVSGTTSISPAGLFAFDMRFLILLP